jgi:hypothetical protein
MSRFGKTPGIHTDTKASATKNNSTSKGQPNQSMNQKTLEAQFIERLKTITLTDAEGRVNDLKNLADKGKFIHKIQQIRQESYSLDNIQAIEILLRDIQESVKSSEIEESKKIQYPSKPNNYNQPEYQVTKEQSPKLPNSPQRFDSQYSQSSALNVLTMENQTDSRGRQQEKLSVMPQKRNMSVGLLNKGNTCFVNSVLQMIAHLPFSHEELGSDQLHKSLSALITLMNNNSNGVEQKLNLFVQQLYLCSDFERGRQADPKYLIIFLFSKATHLINWRREVEFSHLVGRNSHVEKFPPQDLKFFQISPSQNRNYRGLLENTVQKTFLECENGLVTGYCTKCNREVQGIEQVKGLQMGRILMFNFSVGQVTIGIKEIERISVGGEVYELFCIIQRIGSTNEYGHIFCVCKEGNDLWVQYNDDRKRTLGNYEFQISDSYILVFALESRQALSNFRQF